MAKVTKESLAQRIERLEELKSAGVMSLQAEYNLEAYRMLNQLIDDYAELREQYDLDVNPEGK